MYKKLTQFQHNLCKLPNSPPPKKKNNQLRICHAQMLINIFTNMF